MEKPISKVEENLESAKAYGSARHNKKVCRTVICPKHVYNFLWVHATIIFVATVEHGIPLMQSKWVHHQWAHQGVGQGKGSRPANGPPNLPHDNRSRTTLTITTKDRVAFRDHPQPGRRRGGPGYPEARQEARLTPGIQPTYQRRG